MTELDKTGLEAALNTWREATAWGCEPDEAFPSAISAYLEAANTSAGVTEAQTPRVKQLEWRELYEGRFFPKDWHGTGILSARYVVAQHWKDGGFYVLGKEFDTLDAAKAAAQHEYETLVQSALEASRVDAPVSQKEVEPVAWRWLSPATGWVFREEKPADWPSEPLYASPAPAGEPGIKATAESIARIISQSYGEDPDGLAPRARICGPKNERLPNWMVYEEQANAIRSALPTPVSAPVGVVEKLERLLTDTRQCIVCDGNGFKSSGRECGGCNGTGTVLVHGRDVTGPVAEALAALRSPAVEGE